MTGQPITKRRIYFTLDMPEAVGSFDAQETMPGLWDVTVRDFATGSFRYATVQSSDPWAVVNGALTSIGGSDA